MHKIRVLLLTLGVALLMALPASAQEGLLGLSAEDLALLETANTNSIDAEQFSFDYAVTLNASIEGETVAVALEGSGVLDASNGSAQITLAGDAGGLPVEGELRVVGDFIYGRAINPLDGSDTGWVSVNGRELFQSDINFDGLADDFNQEVFGENNIDPNGLVSVGLLLASIDPATYLSATRADSGEQATFTLALSVSDLFRAEGMTDVTLAFSEAIDETLSRAEAAGVNALAAELFSTTVVSLSQTINTAASLVDGAAFTLSTTLDPADISETGEPFAVDFNLNVTLSDYNQPANVTAPENALEVPVSVITDALNEAAPSSDTGSSSPDTGSTPGIASAVELACETAADDFTRELGLTYTGTCPADCTTSTIWGTDTYTDDSSVCTAAIHAGVIPASGGPVTFMITAGEESYASTEQNGINSLEYGLWGGSFRFVTEATTGTATTGTTTAAIFPNDASFPTGLTFSYPDRYEMQTDSDVVTVIWIPNTPAFVQVYDMGSLFGDMDMGRDFFKDTYGQNAATTWNFNYDSSNFEEIEIDGVQYSVLNFEGTQNDNPTSGALVIVPLADGGYTYVQSYSVGTPPDGFLQDTLDIATTVRQA